MGALKYLGESVTGIEIGFWNLWESLCAAVKDGRLRDVQECWHNSTWREEQMIIMSLDDVTVIMLI